MCPYEYNCQCYVPMSSKETRAVNNAQVARDMVQKKLPALFNCSHMNIKILKRCLTDAENI